MPALGVSHFRGAGVRPPLTLAWFVSVRLQPFTPVAVYELAKFLPEYGVGSKFALKKWERQGAPDSYWTVTRIAPKATGRSGKAWGTFTWKGELKRNGEVRRVQHAMKTGLWKVISSEEVPLSGPMLTAPEPPQGGASEQAGEAEVGGGTSS